MGKGQATSRLSNSTYIIHLEDKIAELKEEADNLNAWAMSPSRGADAIRKMVNHVNPNGFNFIDTEMIDEYTDNLEKE